jgi:hypothetical protein
MSLPLGLSYPAVSSSTTPLDEVSTIWKRPRILKLNRSSSKKKKRRPLQEAVRKSGSSDHYSLVEGDRSRRTKSKHTPILIPPYEVAPESPCTSARTSSSRTSTALSSTCHSVAGFPSPSGKSFGDSSSIRSRHVKIVIPDWILPVQRFSASPITLSFGSEELDNSITAQSSHSLVSMADSRNNTLDSQVSAPSAAQLYPERFRGGSGPYDSSVNSSQTSLNQHDDQDERLARTPGSGASQSPATPAIIAGLATPTSSTAGLSGLVCNVHRTTGREPYVSSETRSYS